MNCAELLQFFDAFVADMRATMLAKNSDYTGGADKQDAFANFRMVEELGVATVEQGFLTRKTDKLMRINSLTKHERKVKEETIIDTLKDDANYSILMAAYLHQKSKPKLKGRDEEFIHLDGPNPSRKWGADEADLAEHLKNVKLGSGTLANDFPEMQSRG